MLRSSIFSSDMGRFLIKIIVFFSVLGALLIGACFVLPDRSAARTMLGAMPKKLKQLDTIEGSRVIFVGGSGLGMGMVTARIEKALRRPCYNMGLHAGLGLIYQMKSIVPHLRSGDLVVLVPEYANFEGGGCFGQAELVMMIADIMPEHRSLLDARQWVSLMPEMCEYGAGKLRRLFVVPSGKDNSNDYQDHGDLDYGPHPPDEHLVFPAGRAKSADDFSGDVLQYITSFGQSVHSANAKLVVFPPAYYASSFAWQRAFIDRIETELTTVGCSFVVPAERYALEDRLFRETPYHLNKIGRHQRSALMAEDLERILSSPTSQSQVKNEHEAASSKAR